jgi:hypothetical protein
VACLTVAAPDSAAVLERVARTAVDAGGVPFEAIAGAPVWRYGARLAFRPTDRDALAHALGLGGHPWGLADFAGVRVRADGACSAKAYHRLARFDGAAWAGGTFAVGELSLPVPRGLPGGLYPIMVSLDGDDVELYLRLSPSTSWTSFTARCVATLATASRAFEPHPRPTEDAFGLSLRWRHARLSAVSLFAFERALPCDAETTRAWRQGMSAADCAAYEAAVAGVRSFAASSPARSHHAMLGWTLERDGSWHRAASLRVAL